MPAANHLPTDSADLELSLTPLGVGHQLTLRLTRPGDTADLRRGPFAVMIDADTLRAQTLDLAAYGAALRDALFADPAALTMFAEARATSLDAGRRSLIGFLSVAPRVVHSFTVW